MQNVTNFVQLSVGLAFFVSRLSGATRGEKGKARLSIMRATPQASARLMVSIPENYRCRLIARRAGCCPIPPGGRMFLFSVFLGVSMSKHSHLEICFV